MSLQAHSTGKIDECTFVSNRANQGGAVHSDNSAVAITSTRFAFCFADEYGGALYGTGFTLADAQFDSNKARSYGGALNFEGTCDTCNFTSNVARSGGAIATVGNVELKNAVIIDCVASQLGAAVHSAHAVVISDSLIQGFDGVYSECVESDIGTATDSAGLTCSAYGSIVYCGLYDDRDFSASTMCCACGGGSLGNATVSSDASIFYHDSEYFVLELNRVVFADNEVAVIVAEAEATVMVRNCLGVGEGDITISSLIDCADGRIHEYCTADQRVTCSTTTIAGIEVRHIP